MRVVCGDFTNSWKAVKVLRSPKPKILRQTSLFEYFPSVEPLEEPYEEDDDSFIVEDEFPEIEEEASLDLGPNLFEESEDDGDDEDKGSFFETFNNWKWMNLCSPKRMAPLI